MKHLLILTLLLTSLFADDCTKYFKHAKKMIAKSDKVKDARTTTIYESLALRDLRLFELCIMQDQMTVLREISSKLSSLQVNQDTSTTTSTDYGTGY